MTTIRAPRRTGPCPYLRDAPDMNVYDLWAPAFSTADYEAMLPQVWRRSGWSFYRPSCGHCSRCIPIRVDADRFEPTGNQRRAARRNSDLVVEALPLAFSDERFALYESYRRERFGKAAGDDPELDRASYMSFLIQNPLEGALAVDYRLPAVGGAPGRLVATGYVDVLPNGLSSVYFAWDPAEAKRSVGTWSVAAEIGLCRGMGKRWYYLGFWVPGSETMDYKADFGPAEIALGGTWTPLDAALRAAIERGELP
ncbi:MAG: arginyltransferase [Spirochaetales bacterium]|nr:arginyltransferase [Spirochaetales bacterium]